jgi:hypothetical protein
MLKSSGRKEFVSCVEGLGVGGAEGLNWAKWSSELQEWPSAGPAEVHTSVHERMWGDESPLVRYCSTFLWNWHIPSFQLLAYPIEPVAIVLKLEAVYSSGVSEQACTTWFETPKNNHNLNHRHVKFVFLRNYCHVCECHNSERKWLLVQAVMKAHVGVSVSVAALILNPSTRWRWVVIVMDCHGLVTFLHGKTPLVANDWEGGKVLLPVWMLWRKEQSLPPASIWTMILTSSLLHSFIPFEL